MTTSTDANDPVVAAFRRLPTAAISDALDRLGLPGQCDGIAPIDPDSSFAGRAFTVRYRPIGAVERGTVGDYVDDVPPGSVVVLDNAGRLDCTVWGDLLTGVASRRGVAATVINGVCRDVARARAIGYPIFSRGRFMRTGKDRVEVDRMDVPVSLGTVQVRPGDILVGDPDGVVVIARNHEQDVLAAATEIEHTERQIEADAAAGSRLTDARAKFRYHQLQGPSDAASTARSTAASS
jgi:4-hydroxy-4-methyl-2-oxoglutarate aldolase